MEIGNTQDVAEREEEGTLVHVPDENGDEQFEGEGENRKPVTLRVVGSYSATYKRAREKQRNKNLKRGRSGVTAEALDEGELALHAACVKPEDFGPFTSKGTPFTYSSKNVVLLLQSAPWIEEKVVEAIYDHQRFTKAPSRSL